MKMLDNRLDPSALSARDLRALDSLSEVALTGERPGLVGRGGVRIDLPEPIFHLLVSVVRNLRQGNAIVVMPETEALTTQASAEFLGVSRPFLVKLVEKNQITHHKVGTHRRVYLKDLIEYQRKRDANRRQTLDDLRQKVEAAGRYETIPTQSTPNASKEAEIN